MEMIIRGECDAEMMFGWTSGDIGRTDGETDRMTTWFYECLDYISLSFFIFKSIFSPLDRHTQMRIYNKQNKRKPNYILDKWLLNYMNFH